MGEYTGGSDDIADEAPPAPGENRIAQSAPIGWVEVDAVFQDGLDGAVLGVVEGERAPAGRFEALGAEAPGEPDHALSGAQVPAPWASACSMLATDWHASRQNAPKDLHVSRKLCSP